MRQGFRWTPERNWDIQEYSLIAAIDTFRVERPTTRYGHGKGGAVLTPPSVQTGSWVRYGVICHCVCTALTEQGMSTRGCLQNDNCNYIKVALPGIRTILGLPRFSRHREKHGIEAMKEASNGPKEAEGLQPRIQWRGFKVIASELVSASLPIVCDIKEPVQNRSHR
jgi:hypothetical protein